MGLMEMELARTAQQERMADADRRRRRRDCRRRARERPRGGGGADKQLAGPMVDWPVFSIRIGGLQLAAFRTVRLGA